MLVRKMHIWLHRVTYEHGCLAPHRRQSIVSEWDLVCRDAWKAQATNSGFFLGFLIGAALFGFLADRCGALRPVPTDGASVACHLDMPFVAH